MPFCDVPRGRPVWYCRDQQAVLAVVLPVPQLRGGAHEGAAAGWDAWHLAGIGGWLQLGQGGGSLGAGGCVQWRLQCRRALLAAPAHRRQRPHASSPHVVHRPCCPQASCLPFFPPAGTHTSCPWPSTSWLRCAQHAGAHQPLLSALCPGSRHWRWSERALAPPHAAGWAGSVALHVWGHLLHPRSPAPCPAVYRSLSGATWRCPTWTAASPPSSTASRVGTACPLVPAGSPCGTAAAPALQAAAPCCHATWPADGPATLSPELSPSPLACTTDVLSSSTSSFLQSATPSS